jgi:hypothetical protein
MTQVKSRFFLRWLWSIILVLVTVTAVAFFCADAGSEDSTLQDMEHSLALSAARLAEALRHGDPEVGQIEQLAKEPIPTIAEWTAFSFPEVVRSTWIESPTGVTLCRFSVTVQDQGAAHLVESRHAIEGLGYLVVGYDPQFLPTPSASGLISRWRCPAIMAGALCVVCGLVAAFRSRR